MTADILDDLRLATFAIRRLHELDALTGDTLLRLLTLIDGYADQLDAASGAPTRAPVFHAAAVAVARSAGLPLTVIEGGLA